MSKKTKKGKNKPPETSETADDESGVQSSKHEEVAEQQQQPLLDPALVFVERLGLTPENEGKPGMDTLKAGYDAFKRGNYPEVRQILVPLTTNSDASPKARDGALMLLEAIKLDTNSIIIVGCCAVLFLFIVWTVY